MERDLHRGFDLVTPDGVITQITLIDHLQAEAIVFIENISPSFVGFQIDPANVFFNIKSTLAQLGIDGRGQEYELDAKKHCAQIKVQLRAIGSIGEAMLKLLPKGAYIGKLFAADERRRVRNPDYLQRLFGRSDREGRPLLSLGGLHGSEDLILDKVDGYTVAYLTLQNGRLMYDAAIHGFLPTLARALTTKLDTRNLLGLHQEWHTNLPRNVEENEMLLVRTLPLHIRTVFARVVDNLLSHGFYHTTASVLQPDTLASGDVYELYGNSKREITDIPLEFYTLEPYREHVYFSDRDQLQNCLEDSKVLFKAFATAPQPKENRASVFIVKSDQLLNLTPDDWIMRETRFHEFPGISQGPRQVMMIERFIKQQPSYPFLKAIEEDYITSQGVLLSRHLPSPLMKPLLLSDEVQRCLKRIYFQYPSAAHENFFSTEDRALLHDLEKFAIPVFWVDQVTGRILQYTQKAGHDSGLFVPLDQIETFLKATLWGIYGSHLIEGLFEQELKRLLEGLLTMRQNMQHPLLNPRTPIALVTGGGPGVMEIGNRVARDLHILSCANVVNFASSVQPDVREQTQNPYIEAKMTYRLDKLVERQAEFNLDFPIFLKGGIGTDFEFALEAVRRKVSASPANPILLFGDPAYWSSKITGPFRCNLESGTIRGSEWISNCFYCVQSADQGLSVYRDFFSGKLKTGPGGPVYPEGFMSVPGSR